MNTQETIISWCIVAAFILGIIALYVLAVTGAVVKCAKWWHSLRPPKPEIKTVYRTEYKEVPVLKEVYHCEYKEVPK